MRAEAQTKDAKTSTTDVTAKAIAAAAAAIVGVQLRALRTLCLVSVAALVPTAAVAAADQVPAASPALAAAREELVKHFDAVESRSHLAVELLGRIDADIGQSAGAQVSPVFTPEETSEFLAVSIKLNASLVDQLASGRLHDVSAVRGVDDVLLRSPADATLQPVGLYVPKSYEASKPTPLVVFLHGKFWDETDILAVPWIRQLADETGAIVAAPYARGNIQYVDPAPGDVYATVDLMKRSFNVDPRRVYLAGHSMGGFGVFEVGPLHPEVWTAFLCASGSMTNADRDMVFKNFQGKQVYVVSGTEDDNIPHIYSQRTVASLRYVGIETSFYPQKGGGHNIKSFLPAFRQAWHDMLNGTRGLSGRTLGAPPAADLELPARPS